MARNSRQGEDNAKIASAAKARSMAQSGFRRCAAKRAQVVRLCPLCSPWLSSASYVVPFGIIRGVVKLSVIARKIAVSLVMF